MLSGCGSTTTGPGPSSSPEAVASPLPESGYKAALTLVNPAPQTLHPGESTSLKVKIKNMGNIAWPVLTPGAKGRVTLGNHWLDKAGKELIVVDDGRAELPHDFKPGDEAEFLLRVTAPKTAGTYVLELDMVQEGLTWFTSHGSQVVRSNITVQ